MSTLIETQNVRRVKSAVKNTIQTNGFTAVVGDAGTGKTTLYNYYSELLKTAPEKYIYLNIKVLGDSSRSQIQAIMKLFIQELDPDRIVPGNTLLRYSILKECLEKAVLARKKVILMFDEAQDLNIQVFRDLKKIHEIGNASAEHLFAIILFGKTSSRWKPIFNSEELGKRIKRMEMNPVSLEEIISLAEGFGMKFDGKRSAASFSGHVKQKTPLGVRYHCDVIRSMEGFNGILTQELCRKYAQTGLKTHLSFHRISQTELLERLKEEFPETKITRNTLNSILNGKIDPEEELEAKLQMAADGLISEKMSKAV